MLTDQQIKSLIARAKAERKQLSIRDAGKAKGLEVRANYSGAAIFSFVYKVNGERNRRPLGTYGPAYGLSDARRDVERLRAGLHEGVDPVLAREAQRAAQIKEKADREAAADAEAAARAAAEEAERQRIRLDQLAAEYLAGTRQRDIYHRKYAFSVQPVLGTRAVADIKRADLQRLVDGIAARGANVEAHRVFEMVRAMLRWGVPRDYVTGEPWKGVTLPEGSQARDRVLAAAEIRWVWTMAQSLEDRIAGRILQLLLLTGQRSGEVAGMQRREFTPDLMMWTIPGDRVKNGQKHTVPLPPLARVLIQEAMDASPSKTHLFVGERGKPYRSDTMSKVMQDARDTRNASVDENQRFEHLTVHDIRRTVATGLERMGIPMTVISATLNHISARQASVTQRHYAHADLAMEIRGALTRWQATVEAILAGADPFETRVEDIQELERRMLAKGFGNVARLRVA